MGEIMELGLIVTVGTILVSLTGFAIGLRNLIVNSNAKTLAAVELQSRDFQEMKELLKESAMRQKEVVGKVLELMQRVDHAKQQVMSEINRTSSDRKTEHVRLTALFERLGDRLGVKP